MILLAFDASTLACSACLMKDGTIVSSHYLNVGLTHSQTLLPLIEQTLRDGGMTMKDVDRVAVTVGPGSFTGVKIAVATAKGLAHPNQTPCVPVSSLEALAYGIGFDGVVCAVEDARRGMLYNAYFENGVRLCPDRQISADELAAEADRPLLFCGDGSEIACKAAENAGRSARIISPDRRLIRAESVAMIAADLRESAALPPDKLAPAYLRLPQAERERLERETH